MECDCPANELGQLDSRLSDVGFGLAIPDDVVIVDVGILTNWGNNNRKSNKANSLG